MPENPYPRISRGAFFGRGADHMDGGNTSNKNVLMMSFGLPVMTTAIVIGSMYAGHIMTVKSNIPTHVLVSAATPNIDVNVPEAPPPNIQVAASPAHVDVHVPQGAAPIVTVHPPASPAPSITINPAAPTVTVIERDPIDLRLALQEKIDRLERKEKSDKVATAAASAAEILKLSVKPEGDTGLNETSTSSAAPVKIETPAAKPVEPVKTAPASGAKPSAEARSHSESAKPALASIPLFSAESKPVLLASASGGGVPSSRHEEMSLETLYGCAESYIRSYCKRNNLDTVTEEKKWNRTWKASVEQAVSDNIDSSEQSYINRMVIAKRDYFNIERASPEKIVEACRIMLRYRDGQLAWLSAMKEALTQDNLKKTVTFLSAGPK